MLHRIFQKSESGSASMSMSHVAKTDELWNQIDSFQVFQWKNYVRNRRLASLLIVCGLLLSVGTTAAAFLEYTQIAVFLGLGTTLFIGVREAFNFSEKAEFFCEIHGQAKNLRDQVRFCVNSEADFNAAFDALQRLRQRVARDIPKGKGQARGARTR
jgi:hypothetical protein